MRIPNTIRTTWRVLALLAALALAGSMPATAQTPTLTQVYDFSTPAGFPNAGLIQASDGNFYGTTTSPSSYGTSGTVFRITPGGVITTLHRFSGPDGGSPQAALLQASDGDLYGTTSAGGAHGNGTVFKITLSGALKTLYSFNGIDGAEPYAALMQASDGKLYGTSLVGGASGNGTVFSITPSGTFTTLYSFSALDANNTDGATPYAGLIQASDGSLYGTASNGGANGTGTIFKITTGGAFTTLHSFLPYVYKHHGKPPNGYWTGYQMDGANPAGALMQASDGSLYGTTSFGDIGEGRCGGPHARFGPGTIFKITPSGTFTKLYTFTGSDGVNPQAALLQASDGDLYGTTSAGGAHGNGTVFKITLSGAITTLYSFNGSDGAGPGAALVQASNGTLYGTTEYGGSSNIGTVFKITTSGTLTTLHSFDFPNGAYPQAALLQASDGNLYGTTSAGGAHSDGTVFKITPSGTLTTLYSFKRSDGAGPGSALIQASDGNLYGTTVGGGANNHGTVFKITTSGKLTTLYSFTGGMDGAFPAALIQAFDGDLYGTTSAGGANGNGTVFRISPSGTFTSLHSFSTLDANGNNADGANPWAGLLQASDGNLYGTTASGGASGYGTVFKITTSGTLMFLYSFRGDTDGIYPYAALIQASDGNLYGTTNGDSGYTNFGTVFKITTSGTLTTLNYLGDSTSAALIQASDGNLYGTTAGYFGSTSTGTVFEITTSGTLNTLYSFGGAPDGDSPTALLQASDGNLYGTTAYGGLDDVGTIFRVAGLNTTPVLTSLSPTSTNAGGPAFTLTVKGASFQPFSTVNWNGAPLVTTYVSPTALTASVPAPLIAAPGHAKITVVTGTGGGTSNAKTFTILTTTLKLAAASLTRDSGTGAYTANLTLKDVGFLNAPNIQITKASLGLAVPTTTLPVSLGSVTAGATASTSLGFPASAGSSGSVVIFKVSGTFTGGTFSGSLKVTLP